MPNILQFRIELLEIAPPIWRRIQVPADSSFWDLHVAIQDAMGWTDHHLHAFELDDPKKGRCEIGIPDGDEEHDSYLEWCGGAFDPEEFDPAAVEFDDPYERLMGLEDDW